MNLLITSIAVGCLLYKKYKTTNNENYAFMENEYQEDIEIDPDQLDVEWLRQPTLMLKYTQHESECRKKLDSARRDLDVIKAQLDHDIRNDPSAFDLEKATETAISNAILMEEEFINQQKIVQKEEYELNMAVAAVRSMYVKKDALENLVRLFGQQYFAGPKSPRNLSTEWNEKVEQIEANRKVRIKRK